MRTTQEAYNEGMASSEKYKITEKDTLEDELREMVLEADIKLLMPMMIIILHGKYIPTK